MSPAWRLRRGGPADVAVLRDFNLAMALETEALQLDAETVGAGVEGLIQQPAYGFYLLAEEAGQVLGSLMITYEWSDWRNGPIWWIQSVYVRPEHRRRGIFQGLYQGVREEALAAGARGLRLYVERNNHAALDTYQALGMVDSHYSLLESLFDGGSSAAN